MIFEGDATDFSEVLGAFGRELEQSNEREGGVRVTVAAGHAKFDRATDGTYQEVFVRADAAMYEDKNAYHLAEKDRDD